MRWAWASNTEPLRHTPGRSIMAPAMSNAKRQPLQDDFRLYTEMHLRRDKGPHVYHAFQRSGSGDGGRPETQNQVKTGNIEEPFQERPRLQDVVQRIENCGNQDTPQDFSRQKPINNVGNNPGSASVRRKTAKMGLGPS